MSLPADQLQAMMTQDFSQLEKSNNKKDLCQFISHLRSRVEELESYKLISKRVQMLEKTLVSHIQYNRRESIEIHNLPPAVKDDELEAKCLEVLEDIGCGKIKRSKVHACHRMKNRDKTIIRFVNRKFADLALHNKAKLKNVDKAKYGLAQGKNLYINENLCPPMQFLSYKIREAKKAKKIETFNIWKGKLSIKIGPNDRDIPIRHIQDLIDINLASEDDREGFII